VVNALLAMPAIESHFACGCLHASLHAGNVATGAETFAIACENQSAYGFVSTDMFQRVNEFSAHRVAHGVAFVRPVQGNRGDAGGRGQLNQ
jgi:hypothetical protein